MENQENNQPEEEVKNLDQFQIGRSEGSAADGHATEESDEYTADEVKYADGTDTLLNAKLGPDEEEDDEDDSDLVDDDEYNDSDIEELDKDPNAYDEDDSEML